MVWTWPKQQESHKDFQVKQLKTWLKNKQCWMCSLNQEFGLRNICLILSHISSKISQRLIKKSWLITNLFSLNITESTQNLRTVQWNYWKDPYSQIYLLNINHKFKNKSSKKWKNQWKTHQFWNTWKTKCLWMLTKISKLNNEVG